MAHFQRLIWFAVGVLLAAVPMLASAQWYEVTQITSESNVAVECNQPKIDANAHLLGAGASSLNELAALLKANAGPSFSCTRASDGMQWQYSLNGLGGATTLNRVRVQYAASNLTYVYFHYQQTDAPECDTGQTDVLGKCVECAQGEVWNGTECASCPAGQVKNPYTLLCQEECPKPPASVGRLHTSSGNPICSFGCLQTRGAAPGGSTCVLSLDMGQTGNSSLICDYGYTGAFCGWIGEMAGGDDPPIPEPPGENEPPPPPPDTEPEPPAPEPCPAGFESASVNGVSVCVNSGPPIKNQNTTTTNTTTNNTTNNTTTNTTTTTTTNNVYNQESNTTTTTTTTTITQTIINNTTGEVVGGGSTTTVEQEMTPGNGVPEDTGGNGNGAGECDPASGECGGGSVWSAACGGEVRCEGDAIQCAIARAQHEMKCALLVEDDVLTEFAAIRDFDGTAPGGGLDRKQIEVPASLSVTEIGGGAGLENQSFTLMGQVIEIPFSELNRFIEMFGYAIMVIAWLGAWRIIAGAF